MIPCWREERDTMKPCSITILSLPEKYHICGRRSCSPYAFTGAGNLSRQAGARCTTSERSRLLHEPEHSISRLQRLFRIRVGILRRHIAHRGLCLPIYRLLLAFNMLVAYWTADHEALVSIFSDPGKFYVADPYTFLFASLMVLILGAGLFSVDALVAKRLEVQV